MYFYKVAGFLDCFSVPVISWIEFIGVGWVGGGRGESWGMWQAKGGVKQPFRCKQQCCAFSM